RLTDQLSGAPVTDHAVRIQVGGTGTAPRLADATARSSPGGITALEVPLPSSTPDGDYTVMVTTPDDASASASGSSLIHVGPPTVERLMVSARIDQSVVAPGGHLTGSVSVATPSGSPVRNAD